METEILVAWATSCGGIALAAALSQEELAERAGLSVRAISDLERGVHRVPRLETVRMLADALALSEADRAELLAVARPTPPGRGADGCALPPTTCCRLSRPPLIGREHGGGGDRAPPGPGRCSAGDPHRTWRQRQDPRWR